jgi:hypothetical protein
MPAAVSEQHLVAAIHIQHLASAEACRHPWMERAGWQRLVLAQHDVARGYLQCVESFEVQLLDVDQVRLGRE